jgi:hypothetical protein
MPIAGPETGAGAFCVGGSWGKRAKESRAINVTRSYGSPSAGACSILDHAARARQRRVALGPFLIC